MKKITANQNFKTKVLKNPVSKQKKKSYEKESQHCLWWILFEIGMHGGNTGGEKKIKKTQERISIREEKEYHLCLRIIEIRKALN